MSGSTCESMKIAIMMRPMDLDAAFRSIVEGFVENMIKVGDQNTYLLLYQTPKWFGRFADYHNVKEVLIKAPHKLFWDQIAVPYRAWREGADLIFNPKFSVPLISPCPVVMGLHEPAWWAWPEHYEWLDRNYMKLMLPIYIRKSKHLFPISQFVVDESRKYIKVPLDHTTVAYPAPKPNFRPASEQTLLENFRQRYKLPEKFILSVTRVDHPGVDGSRSFFPGKNVETAVRAFNLCRDIIPHKFVIAGRRVREYLVHMGLKEEELVDVHFTDFIPQEELHLLYNLADLFVLPSYYESYAMTLVEAMSCGCAVVASQTGACPEITNGAALLANPNDPQDFAQAIKRVLMNNDLRQELSVKSLERAGYFSWQRTVSEVLARMREVVRRYRR
jgi:glycosyltransferase involved in cell wall biosynthesis